MNDYQVSDLKIDFLRDRIHYLRKGHKGKQELIAKALGSSKGFVRVLDLTCGLAEDAFFLAQIGFQVKALERVPAIFQILQEAYRQAKLTEPNNLALSRLQICFADAKDYLSSKEFVKQDKGGLALYLDPMYPDKKKSALPRKEMQIFRQVVGQDADSEDLFMAAMRSEVSRVVVKRPVKALPLGPGLVHSFIGKTVRYDLYVPNPN